MPRVVSFFIAAANPRRAIEFYRNVFEWEFNGGEIARGKERFPYWRVRTGDPNEPGIDGVLLPRDRPGCGDGQRYRGALNRGFCRPHQGQ